MAHKKHLTIGSGSAGLSAAEEIRRLNSDDEIKVVTAEDYPPYSPTVLPYFLAGRIDEARLPRRRDSECNYHIVGLARGKKVYDKREDLKRRDSEREMDRSGKY